jgi:hypothetical protein
LERDDRRNLPRGSEHFETPRDLKSTGQDLR